MEPDLGKLLPHDSSIVSFFGGTDDRARSCGQWHLNGRADNTVKGAKSMVIVLLDIAP